MKSVDTIQGRSFNKPAKSEGFCQVKPASFGTFREFNDICDVME